MTAGHTLQLPGELSRRYTPLRELGRGGMGVVVLARDAVLEREVALKLVADHEVDAEAHARFLREVRTMAQLSHPGIVRMFDGGRSGEALFLAMEVLDGKELSELVDRTWPVAETAALLRALLDALAYVHARGILHRDLKPGNVMVVRGAPKLLDFGLARTFEATALTAADTLVGTPRYLAPEVLGGHPHSVRSDVFAVGMIGLEMLIGDVLQPAAEPQSAYESMMWMASGRYVERVTALLAPHGEVGRAVLAALAADPAGRPATAAAFADVLSRVRARRPRRAAAAGSPPARRPLALVAAAGIGVAVLAALALRGAPQPAQHSPSPTASAPAAPDGGAEILRLDRKIARSGDLAERRALVGALLAAGAARDPEARRVLLSEITERALLDHVDDDVLGPLKAWWARESKRESSWRKSQEAKRIGRVPRDWRDAYRSEREKDGDPEVAPVRARLQVAEQAAVTLLTALSGLEVTRGTELALARDTQVALEGATLLLPGALSRFEYAVRKASRGRRPGPALALLQARLHELRHEHELRARTLRRLGRELLTDPGPAPMHRSLKGLRAAEVAHVAVLLCDSEKQLISSAHSAPLQAGELPVDDLIARLSAVPAEHAQEKSVMRAVDALARCEEQRKSRRTQAQGDLERWIGK